ncbi:cobaltochelatase subunit CobS [Veronia nyctiphanis]|uniref:Cobaltochelatase subunit CobS n=1 Tax=Veronia nyctiphanis TaxID=1278244 RepID=A0A4Q0YF15_9GAMM|nr:MoxR family ATPase [Veronia nyctiphanis]RXJ69100.1 cobaltochelatase subunit CobS [Veronia nyctiphanis]
MDFDVLEKPSEEVSVRITFGIDSDMNVLKFKDRHPLVPDIDPDYVFERNVTLAILAGFVHDRRTMVQGMHGTGKSSHIEQVAARLNWPCIRVNLDGHVGRLELIGREAIVIRENKQVTEFQEGILPYCLTRPIALVFDEYDAGRPEVMFVIQQMLEKKGKLALMEQNRVVSPHPFFRLFSTANTVGLGNFQHLYQGTQVLNQAQIDRWNIVVTLNYLSAEQETAIVMAHLDSSTSVNKRQIMQMVRLAALTRQAYASGDLSVLMSPRTVIAWAENLALFDNEVFAFTLTFLNKCDTSEQPLVAELYQRCFDTELPIQGIFGGENSLLEGVK